MKNLKQKVVNAVISTAKNGVKNDVNSTGCGWIYQPKLPKAADQFKKK